jgi:hypothetical protein
MNGWRGVPWILLLSNDLAKERKFGGGLATTNG